jgi:hypothetical protein
VLKYTKSNGDTYDLKTISENVRDNFQSFDSGLLTIKLQLNAENYMSIFNFTDGFIKEVPQLLQKDTIIQLLKETKYNTSSKIIKIFNANFGEILLKSLFFPINTYFNESNKSHIVKNIIKSLLLQSISNSMFDLQNYVSIYGDFVSKFNPLLNELANNRLIILPLESEIKINNMSINTIEKNLIIFKLYLQRAKQIYENPENLNKMYFLMYNYLRYAYNDEYFAKMPLLTQMINIENFDYTYLLNIDAYIIDIIKILFNTDTPEILKLKE